MSGQCLQSRLSVHYTGDLSQITVALSGVSSPYRIKIRVRPNSYRNKVGGSAGEPPRLVVAVQAPAVDGKANDAVIKELAKAFGLRPREFVIVQGQLSRDKLVLVHAETARVASLEARYLELLNINPKLF